MITLTATQLRALDVLRHAAAGATVTGALGPGQGINLRTARVLEQAGLCTVTAATRGGYVRNGRWLKPTPTWVARITVTGMARCASDIAGQPGESAL